MRVSQVWDQRLPSGLPLKYGLSPAAGIVDRYVVTNTSGTPPLMAISVVAKVNEPSAVLTGSSQGKLVPLGGCCAGLIVTLVVAGGPVTPATVALTVAV